MNNTGLKTKRLSTVAVAAFFVTALLCTVLIAFSVLNRLSVEKLTMEQVLLEKGNKANEVLSRLLYKTQTISVFVKDGYTTAEFEQIASTIMDDPSISNILVAPGGVVKDVYPLEGNESVIGLDFLHDEGEGNKEAVLAKETRRLILGGPFNAVQGGQKIVGRLPVYNTAPGGEENFWGIVSVTLKYPEVLKGSGLEELRLQGFEYEIWRINPDSNEKQIIMGSGYTSTGNVHYVEKNVTIQNAQWFFRIYPTRAWYEYPSLWVMAAVGLFISLLVAFVFQNNYELANLKNKFETLSRTDALTGIHNLRYFTELAETQLERCKRSNGEAAVLMMDIDKFKSVNDTYGHLAGDKVLKDLAKRVTGILRPYDIFGRYGGEEFIILAPDIGGENAKNLAERIRLCISEAPVIFNDYKIPVTISIGVATVNASAGLRQAIHAADQALYAAKAGGRNKVV